eukprot:gene3269-13293_t
MAVSIECARAAVETSSPPSGIDALPTLSGLVRFLDICIEGSPVGLKYILPRHYPLSNQALLSVECNAPRHVHDHLGSIALLCASEAAEDGAGCLLQAAADVREAALLIQESSLADEEHEKDKCDTRDSNGQLLPSVSTGEFDPGSQTNGPGPGPGPGCHQHGSLGGKEGRSMKRALIWFHHLKSNWKRKYIVATARELGVQIGESEAVEASTQDDANSSISFRF